MSAQEFVDFMPKYVWHMEEPVCEPQAVALYYVSKMASEHVKVLISGEGGDEAFGGYSIYRNILWLERLKKCLGPLNKPLGAALTQANRLLGSQKIAKYAPLLGIPFGAYYYGRTFNPGRVFNSRISELYTPEFLVHVSKDQSLAMAKSCLNGSTARSTLNRMLYVDTKTSLPDDLLLKADKMTMANSLELRVPFLDHKVLEFAASLPENYKINGFTTKYVAKRALAGLLPREILRRRKVGFPVPYESWLRKELRPWISDVLLDRETLARGYFQKVCIERLISENARAGGFAKELLSLVSLELLHRALL
jgi:asparagine synthase (glutamine-hydrolysing)